ncbi:sensor histidine kinase [Streptomyces peucetius]|uniref:histidine kinase n=1 Tax=Streptomyces peucetius TaxID=1950 RepID=A0ABY6IDK9_STRPE|nr:ATP-binding protein [Streptomyces peucetius]UYQ65101.1 histidine kinase [Streptomyces peucetius]
MTAPPGARVAFGTLVVLVVGTLGLVALDVAASPLGRRAMVTGLTVLVLMPAVLLGQYVPPPYRLSRRWRWGLLLAQAALTYLPLVVFHYPWLTLLGFLAGAVLLTLPPATSVPVALAVGASGPLLIHTGVIDTDRGSLSVVLSTAITASAVFAVAHLALVSARLHGAREQTVRLAEQRTRARMRQDLHDLVGSSLVAIVIRGEAALRADVSAASARSVLAEVVALARRTHEDVRLISGPETTLSLAEEFAHAQRLLTSAGIAVRTSLPPHVEPDRAVVNCLRSVLHEAVGNVLEHSRAGFCEIELRAGDDDIRLTVRNDGVAATGSVPAAVRTVGHRGTGLVGLKGRVIALGGTLHVGPTGREFSVAAVLPLGRDGA